jgi:3-hydroxymyristoyl/3-hydroxydecanoyl-(acyl carrier protein) dehydratase
VILVPEICSSERIANGARLQLKIPADLAYFEGHFPGCPLLPGVVQVSWAIELGRRELAFEGSFRSLSAVKFMRVILPGASVSLVLEYAPDKRQLDFIYEHDGRMCSSGSALFEP